MSSSEQGDTQQGTRLPALQTDHEGKEGASAPGLHGPPGWGLGECSLESQLWENESRVR